MGIRNEGSPGLPDVLTHLQRPDDACKAIHPPSALPEKSGYP